MNCIESIVKSTALDSWVASIDDKDYGPYLSRDMALRVAIVETLARRKCGHSCCIVVEDREGTIIARRCLCAKFAC